MMTPFVMNFYELMSVSAPGLPEHFRKKIKANLGHFVVETDGPIPLQADITILPMEDYPQIDAFERHLNHIFGFTMMDYRQGKAACFLHRGKPDICVFLTSAVTMEIRYRSLLGRENAFYGIFLFCLQLVMKLKRGLLCHGSVVVKDGKAIILSGHQGIGKTPMLLSFLHRGWNYLSDDKFFLVNQELFLMETHVVINQYHFSVLPWLSRYLSTDIQTRMPRSVLHLLDKIASRIWPGGIPVKVYRYLNPGMRINLHEEQFKKKIVSQAKPDHLCILQRGQQFFIDPLERASALDKMALLQQSFFSHRSNLESAILLYGNVFATPARQILEENLPDIRFSLVTFSGESDIALMYDRIASN